MYEAADNQEVVSVLLHCGDLVLRVTRDGDVISNVEILHTLDTPNIGVKALQKMCESAVGHTVEEVADVDTISHATISCAAFKEAIAQIEA